MKCSKAKILLSAELDGELSPSEDLALTSHLAKCASCAQEKAELSSLRGTMALWADEEPSEWLAQSFSYKLKDLVDEGLTPAPKAAPRRRWTIFGSATAGLVAAGLLVVMFVHNQQPVAPPAARPVKPVVANNQPKPEPAPADPGVKNMTVQTGTPVKTEPGTQTASAPEKRSAEKQVRNAPGPKRTPIRYENTVAMKPVSAPPAQVNLKADVSPTPNLDHSISSVDHGMDTPSVEPKPSIAEITVVGVAKRTPEQALKDNIGEAGLAMNENVEKIRGTLQEAVDLLVSKPPMPVKTSTEVDGGSRP